MPLHEYQCETCGNFEVIQKFSDAALTACPTCGRPVQKLLSAPAFQFKGSGWYVTDYARKGNGAPKAEGGEAKSDGGGEAKPATESKGSGDAKPAEAKPAAPAAKS